MVSHYRADVLFTSPFAARASAPDGVLRVLPALRSYFVHALATCPDLHFEAIAALSGVDWVALHYRSVEDREFVKLIEDVRGVPSPPAPGAYDDASTTAARSTHLDRLHRTRRELTTRTGTAIERPATTA